MVSNIGNYSEQWIPQKPSESRLLISELMTALASRQTTVNGQTIFEDQYNLMKRAAKHLGVPVPIKLYERKHGRKDH